VQESTEFFFLSLETIFVVVVVVLILIFNFCFNICVDSLICSLVLSTSNLHPGQEKKGLILKER